MFNHPEFSDHESVTFFSDADTGLKAIVAIHNTTLGGAAGGIRMRNYHSDDEALSDVLRLSRGMTYKSALAGLPLGGGKTVVIGDPSKDKTEALLEKLGECINRFDGRYCAGEDVGMGDDDMSVIARKTDFVARGDAADTAPDTAVGVYLAMQTAVKSKLGRDQLEGVSVAVQGMGKVAYQLAKQLKDDGATVYAADVNQQTLTRAVDELGVVPVSADEVQFLDVDVYSPCALGGVLNKTSIAKLNASIVCGAANNQLATANDDRELLQRDILFLPDYAINAGGIISGACRFSGLGDNEIQRKLETIRGTCEQIIEISRQQNIGTQAAADHMAEQILAACSR